MRKFILNQLEIKKNNIYRLFAGQIQAQMQPNPIPQAQMQVS